jgi:transposase
LTPEQLAADDRRAVLALLAAVAEGDVEAATAILGPAQPDDRAARIAILLAHAVVDTARHVGHDDPAGDARGAIARSVADEATGGEP